MADTADIGQFDTIRFKLPACVEQRGVVRSVGSDYLGRYADVDVLDTVAGDTLTGEMVMVYFSNIIKIEDWDE